MIESKSKPKYKVVIKILGERWAREGSSIESALNKFDLDWQNIKGKGTLTVYKEKSKHVHLYNAIKLRRIFSNKIIRAHEAKNLEYLIKEGVETNIPKNIVIRKNEKEGGKQDVKDKQKRT